TGMPMPPLALSDEVALDLIYKIAAQTAKDVGPAYQRTPVDGLIEKMVKDLGRLGKKNGKGFYAYETDKRGKPKKVTDPAAYELLKSIVVEEREVTDEDIINVMMIPLGMGTVRCLEDGIVDTAAE
ncbi:3-hydroxyacyl-CoA dehydrogenase family protein, partial [Escherichia coli]